MENPDKLATYRVQVEDNQNKNETPYVLRHHYTQANSNNVNKT